MIYLYTSILLLALTMVPSDTLCARVRCCCTTWQGYECCAFVNICLGSPIGCVCKTGGLGK